MSTQLIANPTGAFQGSQVNILPFDGAFSFEFVDAVNTHATIAILQGDVVVVNQVYEATNSTTTATNPYVAQYGVQQAPIAATTFVMGVAMDPIAAGGFATGRVMIRGIAPVVVDTTPVVSGQTVQVGAVTAGRIKSTATATATPGQNIGIVLPNTNTNSNQVLLSGTAYTVGVAAGNAAYIYVCKF